MHRGARRCRQPPAGHSQTIRAVPETRGYPSEAPLTATETLSRLADPCRETDNDCPNRIDLLQFRSETARLSDPAKSQPTERRRRDRDFRDAVALVPTRSGNLPAPGLAVRFLEGLFRDFALDEQLGELASLCPTLERHGSSRIRQPTGAPPHDAQMPVPLEHGQRHVADFADVAVQPTSSRTSCSLSRLRRAAASSSAPSLTITSLRPLIRTPTACDRCDQYARSRCRMASTKPPPSVGMKCRVAV